MLKIKLIQSHEKRKAVISVCSEITPASWPLPNPCSPAEAIENTAAILATSYAHISV
jgi:hypothetical protein